MRQIQTLPKQLQSNHSHNARSKRKHDTIDALTGTTSILLAASGTEPERGDAGAERLCEAAEDGGPEHGFPSGIDGEVEGEGHGEAFGYVVDEEGEEDGESETGVGVVGGVGYEAFGEFVECDCD